MLKNLQQKWKVGGIRLTFILITFALGGSATGYISKKIMNLLSIQHDWLWTIIYILLVTLLWPLSVLVVSIFFGQFKFFWSYIRRVFSKVGIGTSQESKLQAEGSRLQTQIAIFASGAGSNAQKIIEHFSQNTKIKVSLIVCNKPGAGVLQIARQHNIPTLMIDKEQFFRGNAYVNELKEKNISFIVLAGFLWKLPAALIKAYPRKIINIHPALLPKFGGKGMYGNFVHQAVIGGREKESGITIHYVDDHYDNGDIILQVKCPVLDNDTPETLAHRIHALEHANYPIVIEELLSK